MALIHAISSLPHCPFNFQSRFTMNSGQRDVNYSSFSSLYPLTPPVGLEAEGVVANKPTYFEIFTAGAGKGKPEVVVLDPAGRKDTVPAKICPGENDTFRKREREKICTFYPFLKKKCVNHAMVWVAQSRPHSSSEWEFLDLGTCGLIRNLESLRHLKSLF